MPAYSKLADLAIMEMEFKVLTTPDALAVVVSSCPGFGSQP
jgi:hypothetical protein